MKGNYGQAAPLKFIMCPCVFIRLLIYVNKQRTYLKTKAMLLLGNTERKCRVRSSLLPDEFVARTNAIVTISVMRLTQEKERKR